MTKLKPTVNKSQKMRSQRKKCAYEGDCASRTPERQCGTKEKCEFKNMKKRAWCYVMQPRAYGFSCDICNGHNIAWSEFRGCIWCYDCEKDTRGTDSIFDGPIPYEITKMLGISFDRIDLKTGERLYMQVENGKRVWR